MRVPLPLFSTPGHRRVLASIWLLGAAAALVLYVRARTRVGLTAGDGSVALGDDTINFWAGARLALEGRAAEIYDFAAYHAFQTAALGGPIHLYHYSYPPVALLPTAPLGLLPYPGAVAVWMLGGAVVFALVLRAAWPCGPRRTQDALLCAAAAPAVLVNLMTGQTGAWVAALVGGALTLLPRRPVLAGALLGLLVAKPQLALLLPLALAAGRQWRAFLACGASAAALLLASVLVFGLDLWAAYAGRAAVLQAWILEDGRGVWHLMTSVFVAVRHLPAPVPVAYAAQAAMALAVAALVAWAWSRRDAPAAPRNAMLVLGMLLAAPYVQAYDMVLAVFVPVWLLAWLPEDDPRRDLVVAAAAPLLVAPVAGPMVAGLFGIGIAWALLLPALAVCAWLLRGRPWAAPAAA